MKISNDTFKIGCKLLSILFLLTVVLAACSSSDNDVIEPPVQDTTPYVTFSAKEKQYLTFSTESNLPKPNLQYSVNNGEWQDIPADTKIGFGGKLGDLRLRGKSSWGTATYKIDPDFWLIDRYWSIRFDTKSILVDCKGDIRTLVDYEHYTTADTHEACFKWLFAWDMELTSAPDLPATDLAPNCYESMFTNCYQLQKAPKLPATRLSKECYKDMFMGCFALKEAYDLPALELTESCYKRMFWQCSSLTQPPKLPATKLAPYCYNEMFVASSLESAPQLPATELAESCYEGMFIYCNLTTPPDLPATQLATACYKSMFQHCELLQSTPVLKGNLTESCYDYMFRYCPNLSQVTMLAPNSLTDWTEMDAWLDGAGTEAKERSIKLLNEDVYQLMEERTNSPLCGCKVLPKEWQKGDCTVTFEQ